MGAKRFLAKAKHLPAVFLGKRDLGAARRGGRDGGGRRGVGRVGRRVPRLRRFKRIKPRANAFVKRGEKGNGGGLIVRGEMHPRRRVATRAGGDKRVRLCFQSHAQQRNRLREQGSKARHQTVALAHGVQRGIALQRIERLHGKRGRIGGFADGIRKARELFFVRDRGAQFGKERFGKGRPAFRHVALPRRRAFRSGDSCGCGRGGMRGGGRRERGALPGGDRRKQLLHALALELGVQRGAAAFLAKIRRTPCGRGQIGPGDGVGGRGGKGMAERGGRIATKIGGRGGGGGARGGVRGGGGFGGGLLRPCGQNHPQTGFGILAGKHPVERFRALQIADAQRGGGGIAPQGVADAGGQPGKIRGFEGGGGQLGGAAGVAIASGAERGAPGFARGGGGRFIRGHAERHHGRHGKQRDFSGGNGHFRGKGKQGRERAAGRGMPEGAPAHQSLRRVRRTDITRHSAIGTNGSQCA